MDNIMKSLKVSKEERETIFRKIQIWWWDLIRNSWYQKYIDFPYKDFRSGIRNIIKWFAIVWKDRDWDDHYIFKVLKFKIKNTRDRILKNNIICDESQERVKRYATLCITLIDAITEEKYGMEYLDYFESEHIWEPSEQEDKGAKFYTCTLDVKEISNRADEFFKKYPRIYKLTLEDLKKQEREFITDKTIALFVAHKNQERASKLLFKILEQEIYFWWD